MAKQHKVNPTRPDPQDAKPDFAMDLFHPEKARKPAKSQAEESQKPVSVGDLLGADAKTRLERLRQDMEAQAGREARTASASAQRTSTAKPEVRGQGPKATDPDVSFAELFDPQVDDEADFDTLLRDSKLDWKEYK